MKAFRFVSLALSGLWLTVFCPIQAQADIYKSVDKDGKVIYSNVPIKGGKKVELQPITTVAPIKSPAQERVRKEIGKSDGSQQQRQAQEARLAEAQKQLDQARQALKEAEESPNTFRTKSGGIGRNVSAYEEKIKALQEEVARREQAVETIKREISAQ